MKLKNLLKEVLADRYTKHGYTPEQVAGIADYFKRLNLIKLGRRDMNGPRVYWVKNINDKLPVVMYDDNKLVHVDDNVVKDIISKVKPAFGSPETSGDRSGYNPPYVAFGNAVMEWVAQQLNFSDAYLDKRLTGTNPLSPFVPTAKHAMSRTVPNDLKRLSEAVSVEAAQLHAMVNCGQDAAQDFFDENNIDAKALVDYVSRNKQTNPTLVYDVRDYISGRSGTVGGEKRLRDRFIKQFQLK